jgi:hypothetical protein
MISLEAVVAEVKSEHQWWGHTEEHGWVVLDRDDARNETNAPSRYMVRCRDWVSIEVSRADFSDRFKSFQRYIGALPDDQARAEFAQFLRFRQEFVSRLASFRVTKEEMERRKAATECQRQAERLQNTIKLHRRFLKGGMRPDQGVPSPPGPTHRVDHCWSCKQDVDNAIDLECAGCGRIVCRRCGACGCCGWLGKPTRYMNQLRSTVEQKRVRDSE